MAAGTIDTGELGKTKDYSPTRSRGRLRQLVVYIATDQLQLILNHARSTYPEECCGFLLGIDSENRRIHRVYAVQNVNKGSRQNRFNINPMDLVHADDEARRSNIDLVGIYH